MCSRRAPVAPKSTRSRSAITNRSKVHQQVDARSATARRFRDLIAAFSADLGDDLSEADMAMVRTAAGLTLKSELMQADLAAGKDVDAETLIKLAGTSRRALAAIAVKAAERKPNAMTLADYMARKAAEAAELQSDDDDTED
jgi:ribosomal protein L12E/L44/L45/RPP1/RPP2